MPYQNVYFYLNSEYKHGRGWSCPEAGEAFRSDINRLFTDAGWEIRSGQSSGCADSAIKGMQELYLHPMMASGVILQDEIPAIENILRGGSTFTLREVRGFEIYQDMSDEDYQTYLDSKRDEMTAAILEHFRTKRKNLYITGYSADKISAPYVIKRVQSKEKYGDKAELLVSQLIQELIEGGQLVTAQTRNGQGIRTATDVELAQWQPSPGQETMEGMNGLR